jgi:YD repeat-containing protein
MAATYRYDELGRLTEITWDSGRAILFTYDANGNMINVLHRHSGAETHGRLSVAVNGTECGDTAMNELAALIGYAQELLKDTYVSDDGINVPAAFGHWASRTDHKTFETAISTAQNTLDSYDSGGTILSFAHGESFDVVLRIDENMGFANMMTRLYIPHGLELTGFSHNDSAGISNNLVSPVIPIIGSGYALVGWEGRTQNITGDIDLFTFTFTVADNAASGLTEPITISFVNAPTDAFGDELQISLPCGIVGTGEISIVGGVFVSKAE